MILGEVKIANYRTGDPAYPLTSFRMKEHESCKSNGQRVLKSMMREARNLIECVYRRLKARWSILNNKKLESILKIILTCFALHNFCERNKKGADEDLF